VAQEYTQHDKKRRGTIRLYLDCPELNFAARLKAVP